MARMLNASLSSSLRPALPGLLAGTAASTLSALCMLAALWCLVRLVGEPMLDWVLAALGFWLAGAALSAGEAWLSHAAEARFSASLRRQAAAHLLRLPASTLARQGDVALRRLLSDDIAALHHMVAHLPAEVAVFIVVPLTSIVLLVMLAGPAALWVLLPGAVSALYQLVWAPRLAKRFGAHRMETMNEMVAAVDDYARGIRVHRLYGTQSGALASYHAVTQHFTRHMDAWVAQVGTPAAIAIALLQAVATFAIAYAVAWQSDASALAAVLLFSLAIVTPALRLGHGLDYVVVGRAAAARLAALFAQVELADGEASLPQQDTPVLDIRAAVLELDGHRVLHGLSHRFAPGALTAITGASGSGKTSLLRVLSGWEPLSGGTVSLAGVNLAQLDAQARHQAILLVPQGGDVLQATVRENLVLTAPEASDAQLNAALQQAQFSIDLEADATTLSGGEKQRVGLARAFLTTAPVVLLDEPTSALDSANAMRLMDALHTLAQSQGKTVVLVTHDPALAARADECLNLSGNTTTEASA